jgi:hypothetical protein
MDTNSIQCAGSTHQVFADATSILSVVNIRMGLTLQKSSVNSFRSETIHKPLQLVPEA